MAKISQVVGISKFKDGDSRFLLFECSECILLLDSDNETTALRLHCDFAINMLTVG